MFVLAREPGAARDALDDRRSGRACVEIGRRLRDAGDAADEIEPPCFRDSTVDVYNQHAASRAAELKELVLNSLERSGCSRSQYGQRGTTKENLTQLLRKVLVGRS